MDYLVVAPNTPHYQWQIALLAQSFKLCGLQENLCVILAVTDDSPNINVYYKHFADLPRLKAIRFPTDPDPDILRLDGVSLAVSQGLVGSSFICLPPHCVLRHPVKHLGSNIVFNCRPDFTFSHLNSYGIAGDEIVRRLGGRRQWIPVGEVFGFKNVDVEFFRRVAERSRLIGFDSYRKIFKEGDDRAVKGLFRAGMSLSILEHFDQYGMDTSVKFECQMTDADNSSHFINYSYGSPPDFNKIYYQLDGNPFGFSDSPFSAIMRADASPPADFMKRIVATMIRPS